MFRRLQAPRPRPPHPLRRRRPAIFFVLAGFVTVLLLTALPAAAQRADSSVAQAQELLDAQRPSEALRLLDRMVKRDGDNAQALLLRSSAHFMLGDMEPGRRDLDRALALDPELRQGWLNRAALAVAEERYDDAVAAFRRAEALDPAAPENDVNVGTALLLQGDLASASERFSAYLGGAGDTAEGYYLVASNYALAGYAALAVEHLRGAIERDERTRRRARTDPNFRALQINARFRRLMSQDHYQPPAGSHVADATFDAAYRGGQGPLLPAVLDALQLGDRPFDPNVEVTDTWALIWGDVRIKVFDTLGDQGRVQLSAPARAFTPAEWKRVVSGLLARIERQAMARSMGQDLPVVTPGGNRQR